LQNFIILAYAGIAYILAMANIGYIVAFLADFGVPKTVNSGSYDGNPWRAAAINAALVIGFGLHHSITARTAFKRWWTRFVPDHLERATYLYMTAAATALLVVFWQPIPITLWRVEAVPAIVAITGLYLAIWAAMFAATFQFGHLGFFGLAQAWRRVHSTPQPDAPFASRWLYAVVRHPISLGWMLTPWIVPHFTVGQLVFAVVATAYVLIATPFEEADLTEQLGDTYRRYRERVPAFLPFPRASGSESVSGAAMHETGELGSSPDSMK
jgi:methanethiol S-methyltransferase